MSRDLLIGFVLGLIVAWLTVMVGLVEITPA